MKKYLFLLLMAGLLMVNVHVFSQDIHFSQYYAPHLSLNPAGTGFYNGDWRAYGIYRSQWKTISVPYVTRSIGFDHQFYVYSENMSWGFNFINDKSGSVNLTSNQFYLSFAYHKLLPHLNYLHFGLQAGYVLKGYSLNGQTYPEQWDMGSGQFNSSLTSGEPGNFDQPSFLDLNGGVIWSRTFKKIIPQAGYAMYHINQPKSVYTSSDNKLAARHVFHSEVKINMSKLYVTPRFMFMSMSKANDFISGAQVGYYFPANALNFNSCWFGGYIRNVHEKNKDAAYFVLGVNYNSFDIGASYDLNISDLKAATKNRGAFEISVIYTAPSSVINKKVIPCDRY